MYGNSKFLLRSVRTRYVKLMNADDFWTSTMLGDAVQSMESDPSFVHCYPKAVLVDQDGREIRWYENPVHLMEDDLVVRFTCVLMELVLVNQTAGRRAATTHEWSGDGLPTPDRFARLTLTHSLDRKGGRLFEVKSFGAA